MIQRLATAHIQLLAKHFPAVLILGARQTGKTTLVRQSLDGAYFDLERPSDHAVFAPDPEFALMRLGKRPLILDEAQVMPELFSVLRSVIDDKRSKKGRFYLLGSVNPTLVRAVSESLAGRVATIELTPFLFAELASQKLALNDYWLRGGFPEAILAASVAGGMRWLEQYVQSLINRDFVQMGVTVSPIEMTRFLGMVASMQGGILNASSLGNSLGISYHTANRYLDIAEGHFIIRRLHPWFTNIGKRLVKSPKVYIRDSGIFHVLVGDRTPEALYVSPRRGVSWEGMLIEQIITCEQLRNFGSRFWFYRTATGTEIDLIVERGTERIGFEFKTAHTVGRGDIRGLEAGLRDGVISHGMVVHSGEHRYPLADKIESVPATELLSEMAKAAKTAKVR